MQSFGRGRISWEGALDVRESREHSDKIFAEKTKRQNFGSETAVFKYKSVVEQYGVQPWLNTYTYNKCSTTSVVEHLKCLVER